LTVTWSSARASETIRHHAAIQICIIIIIIIIIITLAYLCYCEQRELQCWHRALYKKEMAEESSTISHLSVAMTSKEIDKTQTADEYSMMSSFSIGYEFYMQLAVVFIGIIGTAGNGLILYALFASKQHKKHLLIVNQNALDLFASFFLSVTYVVQMFNIRLSGELGYWLCITLLSEILIWVGTNGSMINLALITIDRYLMVVHPVLSKKWLRPWVIYSAVALAWFLAILYNTVYVLYSTEVIDGYCHSYVITDDAANMAVIITYILFYYFIILVIFIFCYWYIVLAIRRQAKVMASHNAAGPRNASQAQSVKIQNNVIKTMILVSALYAIAWMPFNIYYLLATAELLPYLSFFDSRYYALTLIAFLYTSTNPFIYATKFNPVKKILVKMIPCKKTAVQPTDGSVTTGTRTIDKRTGDQRY